MLETALFGWLRLTSAHPYHFERLPALRPSKLPSVLDTLSGLHDDVRKILYGYKNRTIEVLKFLTHTEGENSRLTWLGRVVSQTGVDELLQLINVLRGEMSIVGRQNMPRWSPSIR